MQALALGADGVLIGRPIVYALAIDGQQGVERALEIIRKEFRLSMMLLGCAALCEIQRGHVLAPGECIARL